VELFEEGRTLVCIADGCSWGEPPRQAARKATDAYMAYLRDNQRSITDLRDAGRLILRAFQKAHIKILEGTTTLTRPARHDTTRHDTTRHDTTRHDTTHGRALELTTRRQDTRTCGWRAPPPCAADS
jgi:hypothetical protein